MPKLFENILISSPNGGGLFFCNDGDVFCLDSQNSTGIFFHNKILLRGVQPNKLCIYSNPILLVHGESANFDDIHDVFCGGGFCYLVATARNEIVKLTIEGEVLQRWTFPGERDSWHINCLGSWQGRIIFSAFGDFREHRAYKGKSSGNGFVQDLFSGERLISGLSQPHSLIDCDDNLLIANSENQEILEFSIDGKILRSKQLNGYTRGICVHEDVIYVGLSCSRNIENSEISTATIVALSRSTLTELARLEIFAKEIYGIQHIPNMEKLPLALATINTPS